METSSSKPIARASLSIDGIKMKPVDPFTWASGYKMPMYNDNRRLLDSYEHRMLVTNAFREIINAKNISFDYILGTSTAGIAPAANLSQALNVPMLIMSDGVPFNCRAGGWRGDDFDAVASTCPWGIPTGINIANESYVSFMYVRASPKNHGLQQQIEGIPREGQRVLLINYFQGQSYFDDAVKALAKKGVSVVDKRHGEFGLVAWPISITGQRVLIIEDLISTGGSSAAEVQAVRDVGGIVNNTISIFDYGFAEAKRMFTGEVPYKDGKVLSSPCAKDSCLDYATLLEVAKEDNKFSAEQLALLAEWQLDPFNWGAKHGFPKVEKK